MVVRYSVRMQSVPRREESRLLSRLTCFRSRGESLDGLFAGPSFLAEPDAIGKVHYPHRPRGRPTGAAAIPTRSFANDRPKSLAANHIIPVP